MEFGEGEGKVSLDNIVKRAAAYKPKEWVTYKMIQEYIEAKYELSFSVFAKNNIFLLVGSIYSLLTKHLEEKKFWYKHFGFGRLLLYRRRIAVFFFYFARQIFDLSEYYRYATDQEVQAFTASDKLFFEDTETFKNAANTGIRRKIALIDDSDVLVNYKASEIKKLAKDVGITITIEN